MNIEELRDYCMAKPCVTEEFPFDEVTLVFKVGGKMFLLTSLDTEFRISLKNDPEKVIDLQERYSSIIPGVHLNKKYWITVMVDGSIGEKQVYDLIDESYNAVVNAMPKKTRLTLGL